MKFLKILLFIFTVSTAFAQKQKVWLDADTGNEIDDVWAIVRLFFEEKKLDIVGFSSAHFNNADMVVFEKWNQYSTKEINTVKESQAVNEEILLSMGLQKINHPMGADRQMGRAWGGYEPRESMATKELLAQIKILKPKEKLDIITLGALTNIASALALEPSIINKIRVFSLGGAYNFTQKAWNKNEFNVRVDLNAFDYFLNLPKLDWTVLSTGVIYPYIYDREDINARFIDAYAWENQMKKRWKESNPNDKKRVLWDLGLVQLYLNPKYAKIEKVMTPPENHQHLVKMYKITDMEPLYKDFWESVEKNRK